MLNAYSQVHAMIQKGIRGELPGQKITNPNTNTELSSKNDNHEENPNYMQDLERLIDWKQRSVITEEEFQNLKSLLLKKLPNKNHTVSNTQQKPQQQSTNSAADNNSVASLLVYENSRLGIKMEYPFDWKKEESDDSVSFYPPGIDLDKDSEEFSIFVFPSENKTLSEAVNEIIKFNAKDISDFELIKSNPVSLKGNQAHKLE
jgi:hypothetical protein